MIGFFGDFKSNKNHIVRLIEESAIRGTHSFGYSFLQGEQLKTVKAHSIDFIIKSIIQDSPDKFIFHNRYSTSGDWKEHKNNQPITLPNKSIVLNGVISQASKEENEEQYSLSLKSDNDAEIFLAIDDKALFLKHKGSFAGLYYDQDFFYFRNARRPLWSLKRESLFIASTEDIFLRSGLGGGASLLPKSMGTRVSEL